MKDNLDFSKDPLLLEVVHWANVAGLETPITIISHGAIITGIAIGVKTYFDLYAKQWHNALENIDKAAADILLSKYTSDGELIQEKAKKETTEAAIKNIYYIHLKEAKIISGNQFTPTNSGILWRGKVADISGFSIGTFAIKQ